MNTQTKLLILFTVLAFTIIGTYAWRVLPSYLKKVEPVTIDKNTPQPLRILATDQTRGSRGASKTIIAFGDIECPYCGQTDVQINEIIKQQNDVRLVWKDCPLPQHPNAQKAAEAAHCAGDQGKYWEYHDLLIQNNDQLGPELYASTANALALNTDVFTNCLTSGTKRNQVLNSLNECAASGVNELPWYSINGKTFSGSSIVVNLINELNSK